MAIFTGIKNSIRHVRGRVIQLISIRCHTAGLVRIQHLMYTQTISVFLHYHIDAREFRVMQYCHAFETHNFRRVQAGWSATYIAHNTDLIQFQFERKITLIRSRVPTCIYFM